MEYHQLPGRTFAGHRTSLHEHLALQENKRLDTLAPACGASAAASMRAGGVRHFRLFILIIALCAAPVAWSDMQFSEFYVLGDSLSDAGNLASITNPLPPPFFNNRISNGPNSVDILARRLGLQAEASLHLIGPPVGTNYAVAGARAARDDSIDLTTQVRSLRANLGDALPADALYVVFIGGNDVRDARDSARLGAAIRIVLRAVRNEVRQIQQLIDSGARYILVYNVADVGRIPDSRIAAQMADDPSVIWRASKLSRLYNTLLRLQLKVLEYRNGFDIMRVDFFAALANVVNNPQEFGFTNAEDACFSQISFSFNPGCDFGANFPQFVFFDEIHPTAPGHVLLGNAAFEQLSEQFRDNEQSRRHGNSAYRWVR